MFGTFSNRCFTASMRGMITSSLETIRFCSLRGGSGKDKGQNVFGLICCNPVPLEVCSIKGFAVLKKYSRNLAGMTIAVNAVIVEPIAPFMLVAVLPILPSQTIKTSFLSAIGTFSSFVYFLIGLPSISSINIYGKYPSLFSDTKFLGFLPFLDTTTSFRDALIHPFGSVSFIPLPPLLSRPVLIVIHQYRHSVR